MEPPPEAEFFGAAAGVAGTLWVITFGLFTFATVSLARLRNSIGDVRVVLLISSMGIITISVLFLGSLVVALAMLMPQEMHKDVLGHFFPDAVVLLLVPTLIFAYWGHQRARRRLGAAHWGLVALYVICGLILLAMSLASTCVGIPEKGICQDIGFDGLRADLVVLIAMLVGCVLSLLLGIFSMQTELATSWGRARE